MILIVPSCLIAFGIVSCSDDDDETTSSSDEIYNNVHDAVDLGLSVMWATCNVGAESPEDYGDYFSWGETETKDSYTSSNCVTNGVEIDDIAGNAEYDAATANWGDSWRMPTRNEFKELVNSCTWEWTTQNNVDGYLVTGSNGNSIFLPAAGTRYETSLHYAGSEGYYWSSTPIGSSTKYAYCLCFYSGSHIASYDITRYNGLTVRPVSE